MASHIDSDHVVEVVAAGIDEVGAFPWLVMEFLEGEELGRRVERAGRLPPNEATEVISQLFHGVARAHAAGIVHRDLKPENVFLARPRRAGVPFTLKILDFGIAKLLHDAKTHATTQALGTPLWMAPEQSDQRSVVSPATDVWALALLAFWISTGRHYWLAAENPAATLTGLLREILIEPMPLASIRAAERGATLPPGFDDWFLNCTQRDPKLRPQTAQLAFEGLQPLLPRSSVESALALTGTVGLSPAAIGSASAQMASGQLEAAAPARPSEPIAALGGALAGSPSAPPTHDEAHAHGYFHPLVYPLSDPGSAAQIWWVALINYLPFINLFLLRGFRLELTRRVLRDERPFFPPPSHMGAFFFQGALLWSMTALYLLPPLLLMALTGLRGLTAFFGDLLTLAGIALGLTEASLWEFVVRELWTSFLAAVVDSVWAILSLPLYRAAMIHYAVTGRLSAFFAIHTNIGFIVRHRVAFANVYLFSFLVNTIIAFVSLGLMSTVVGAFAIPLLALPVYYWTTGYEYGLLAKRFAEDLANPATRRGQLRWLLVPAALALLVHQCTPAPLPQPDIETVAAAAQPGCAALLGRPESSPRSGPSVSGAAPAAPTIVRTITPPASASPPVTSDVTTANAANLTEIHIVQEVVEAYYGDLQSGTFDARRYFAPRVERFVTMQGTTPAAINAYINGAFRSQFKNPTFSLEPETLEREADGTFVYAERSAYYFVAKKKQVSQRYKVRVRLAQGKLSFYHQFERLPAAP